jgi:hypothetical protein
MIGCMKMSRINHGGRLVWFFCLETGFRPAIYYIATTPTIQEFGTKVLGQQQKHAQNKRNEDNDEATKR